MLAVLALALMSVLSFEGCASKRTAATHQETIVEGARLRQDLQLIQLRDTLLQNLTITLDDVEFITYDTKDTTGQPGPAATKVTASKAVITQSTEKALSIDEMISHADTAHTVATSILDATENTETTQGGKPPNWTLILTLLGSIILFIFFIFVRASAKR